MTIIGTKSCAKLGTVQASELVRSFLRSERPSSLASAIMELGPANKTIYLLNYVDDTAYRRRILTQLNRGQSRHRVIRAICYGRRGEIRKPYRQDQEDQLSALGVVTNAVMLWNTIYMEAAPRSSEGPGHQDPTGEPGATVTPDTQAHLYASGAMPSHSPNRLPTAPCVPSIRKNSTTLSATLRSNDCHGPCSG